MKLTTALHSQGATLAYAGLIRGPKISLAQRLQNVEQQFCKQFISQADDHQESAETSNTDKAACLSKKRVLLVEDNPIIQKIHCKYLEMSELTVDVACNGKQALDLYKPNYYAVVFLDGGQPDISGFDLAKIIRCQQIGEQRQLLIMLTGFDRDDVREKCLEADIDTFAIKPISKEELQILIEQWVH
jgi:CheY-like chemotaxis protein